MLDWSDRHCRFFWRLISKHARLYTEMVTTGAIIHGDKDQHLTFNHEEHPVALQLGGSDAKALVECSKIGEDYGYDEINLNVGCPSQRVQNGSFGACLMKEPELVAECVSAMQSSVNIPITIKCRIGVDDHDDYEFFERFVSMNRQAGCKVFIVHARKAFLQGLSPKENRDVPPLHYDVACKIKQQYPELTIVVNGGINTHQACKEHLSQVDGVMIGREAYQNPMFLAEVDQRYFDASPNPVDSEILIQAFLDYAKRQQNAGVKLHHMTRHILGTFNGKPGARQWRRHLSENAWREGATTEVLKEALALVKPERNFVRNQL